MEMKISSPARGEEMNSIASNGGIIELKLHLFCCRKTIVNEENIP
jgi:hypothetical protein